MQTSASASGWIGNNARREAVASFMGSFFRPPLSFAGMMNEIPHERRLKAGFILAVLSMPFS